MRKKPLSQEPRAVEYRDYISRIKGRTCDCTRPAVRFFCGAFVCQRCYNLAKHRRSEEKEEEKKAKQRARVDFYETAHIEAYSLHLPSGRLAHISG